jgi:hypothetical protein
MIARARSRLGSDVASIAIVGGSFSCHLIALPMPKEWAPYFVHAYTIAVIKAAEVCGHGIIPQLISF